LKTEPDRENKYTVAGTPRNYNLLGATQGSNYFNGSFLSRAENLKPVNSGNLTERFVGSRGFNLQKKTVQRDLRAKDLLLTMRETESIMIDERRYPERYSQQGLGSLGDGGESITPKGNANPDKKAEQIEDIMSKGGCIVYRDRTGSIMPVGIKSGELSQDGSPEVKFTENEKSKKSDFLQ
jgi:hypothetical protein